MTPKRKKSRVELRTEATRETLINAARMVFAEKGLDLTTIDDITRRADVGKGTFYYHFDSKAALISELMKSVMSDLSMAIDEKCRDCENLAEAIDSLIVAHIRFFDQRWEDFVIHFQGRADLTLQEGYEGIETPFNIYLKRIADLLDSMIHYQLDRGTLRRISYAVAGFVSGYYSFAVVSSEEKDFEQILLPVRGALVAAITRFIKEAIPDKESPVRW